MRLGVFGGVVVMVANGWAESRWRLRMLCDLPRRFERCYSAEDRMFDGLQACTIVIAKWTRRAVSGRVLSVVWVSSSVLEGGDRCYYAIRRHTRCQLMRPSQARPSRRRTVRAVREIWTRLMAYCGLQACKGILLNAAEKRECYSSAVCEWKNQKNVRKQ
jgi:hypothetical protein